MNIATLIFYMALTNLVVENPQISDFDPYEALIDDISGARQIAELDEAGEAALDELDEFSSVPLTEEELLDFESYDYAEDYEDEALIDDIELAETQFADDTIIIDEEPATQETTLINPKTLLNIITAEEAKLEQLALQKNLALLEEITKEASKIDDSNIKPVADLFELDRSEFTIEDFAVNDTGSEIEIDLSTSEPDAENSAAEVTSANKTQNILTAIAAAEAAKVSASLDIVAEVIEVAKNPITEFKPRPRPEFTYKTQINPPVLNQRIYPPGNEHLDSVEFREEYFQYLFAAIDQRNLVALRVLTEKIGLNNLIFAAEQPPLIYAINRGDINVIRKLLNLGYDANQADEYGNRPIHLAIIYDRPDIVTELIKHGANLTVPDPYHRRPLSLAYEVGNQYIVNLIYQMGGAETKNQEILRYYLQNN